jgi:hypothetical protein
MKYTVLSAVKFNGRIYAEGETIDADAKGAATLPEHCVKPAAAPTPLQATGKAAQGKQDGGEAA